MKVLKTPYAYLLLVYLPILIVGACLAIFLPQWVVVVLRLLNGIFLLVILWLAFSRNGKQLIGDGGDSKNKKQGSWLMLLFCLQISVVFIFIVFANSCVITLPIPDSLNGNSVNTVIKTTSHLLSFHSALFPWPVYLLFSMAFAFFDIKKRELSTIKESLRFVLKNEAPGYIGAGADMLMKQGLFFACVITIGVSILQISQVLCQRFGLVFNTGLHFTTLFLGMFIFLLLASRFWRRITHDLWYRRCSLKTFLPLMIVFLVLLMVIFTALTNVLSRYLPVFAMPVLQLPFHMPQSWLAYWQLLVMIWWLGWTPLIGYFIANLAQGRTLRELILVGLALPFVFGLLAEWINHTHYDGLIISQLLSHWPVVLLLSLISITLIIFFFRDNAITYLFTAAGSGKNSKQRVALSMVRSFLLLIATTTIVYLLVGIPLMTLLSTSIVVASFAAVAAGCIGYIGELKK